jgi:hypothetical protein
MTAKVAGGEARLGLEGPEEVEGASALAYLRGKTYRLSDIFFCEENCILWIFSEQKAAQQS